MKFRILTLILALPLVFTLASCEHKSKQQKEEEKKEEDIKKAEKEQNKADKDMQNARMRERQET